MPASPKFALPATPMPAVNHRISARQRREKAVVRAKPFRDRPVAEAVKAERVLRFKGWFALLVLLPVLFITVCALVEFFFRANIQRHFWRTDEFLFFLAGTLVWGVAYWAGWRPVTLYVFAHEVTHLLVAKYLFRGKIFDWKFSASGGYVETNKSNTWITLGPYLVPLYTLLVMFVFGVAACFWDVMQWHAVGPAGWQVHVRGIWALYLLVGLTWAFHLTFTLQTVHVEQGDLTRNGEFFSMLLIVLVNLLLITLFFVAASPSMSLGELGRCWLEVAAGVWRGVTSVFTWR